MGRKPPSPEKKAGNGISWTFWCHTRQEAPGNSLMGRLKPPRVSASGVFLLHFPRHGKSASWETHWISEIYGGQSSPRSSRRELSPCHPSPAPLQVVPCPPRAFLGGLSSTFPMSLSFPAPCTRSWQKGKPFPTLMLFDLCGFISTWREEEESIIPYIH